MSKSNLTQLQIDEIINRYHHLRYGLQHGFTREHARSYLATDLGLSEDDIVHALSTEKIEQVSKFQI